MSALSHEDLNHPAMCSVEALMLHLKAARALHKRVVFTNGCFDIVHPGHVDLLARAKTLGDVLVLGVNADESVRRLGKAPDRPINPYTTRAFVLAHLASVDFVVRFDEDTPLELITRVQPDILVKGGDWAPEQIVGRDVVIARGGEVHSLPLLANYSTTRLIAQLRGS